MTEWVSNRIRQRTKFSRQNQSEHEFAFVYGRSTSKRASFWMIANVKWNHKQPLYLANVIICTQHFVSSLDCLLAHNRTVSMHLYLSNTIYTTTTFVWRFNQPKFTHMNATSMDSLLHTYSSSKLVSNQNIPAEYLSLISCSFSPYSYHSLTFFIHHVPAEFLNRLQCFEYLIS